MKIEDQFNIIAKEYDSKRKMFIPCFDDYYKNTTDFLASCISKPKHILDLGAGTGLLSSFWYNHFPKSEYVLVDIADEMLKIARERFDEAENVLFQILDYTNALPSLDFDLIISALSIHHLEGTQKENLFKQVYDKLPDGGMFVNYDQFSGGTPNMDAWYNTYWENQLKNSKLSKKDIELWQERRKFDKECSVEEEIKILEQAGFRLVKCVYSYQKFSVISAIK